MNYIKKYNYIYKFMLYILIICTIQTIINLILKINTTTNQLISLISIILYIFTTSIIDGKKTTKKAYKQGLKMGLIYILILYILGIPFLVFKINLKKLIYFLIIVLISTLGTIIGINKKTQ